MHYRKIYEQHYGPIPKDQDGRTYEIHHIDSNHDNNAPENLMAITIQEHYDIHESQGDWSACQNILIRMNKTSEEISEKCKELNKRRIQDGTHNFLGGEIQRETNRRLVNDGTHPLLRRPDGTSHASDRVSDGTHPFLGGEIQRETNRRLVNDGTHNFQTRPNGTNLQTDRIAAGAHHFITNNPSKNLQEIICSHCGKIGKGNVMKRYHFDNCKLKRSSSE